MNTKWQARIALLLFIIGTWMVSSGAKRGDCYVSPTLTMSCQAVSLADGTWAKGQHERSEMAMCATQWDTVGGVAHIERLEVDRHVLKRDSLHVWYDKTICGDSLPNIHTHLIDITEYGVNWRYEPSPTDSADIRERNAPFYVLMSDTNRYKVYR